MATLIVYSQCHPKRRALRNGRCRECCQVGRAESPDDMLPAIVANTVQHAGPRAPPRCPKCSADWWPHGDWLSCPLCGSTFYRTSLKVIAQPRNTVAQVRAAWELRQARRDRER